MCSVDVGSPAGQGPGKGWDTHRHDWAVPWHHPSTVDDRCVPESHLLGLGALSWPSEPPTCPLTWLVLS